MADSGSPPWRAPATSKGPLWAGSSPGRAAFPSRRVPAWGGLWRLPGTRTPSPRPTTGSHPPHPEAQEGGPAALGEGRGLPACSPRSPGRLHNRPGWARGLRLLPEPRSCHRTHGEGAQWAALLSSWVFVGAEGTSSRHLPAQLTGSLSPTRSPARGVGTPRPV